MHAVDRGLPAGGPDPVARSELSGAQIDRHTDEGEHRLLDVHVVVATHGVYVELVDVLATGDPHHSLIHISEPTRPNYIS
jgi:hypothetical protein